MKIPNRWLNYSESSHICGTRFVAFKVPLREGYSTTLPENKRFTPKKLLNKHPKIKLIIDLTYTTKYYSGIKEFEGKGVRYVKIKCRGRQIPKENNFRKFTGIVSKFLATNPEDFLIGVHCTHGVNRTGYFIVRYMTESLGYTIQESLEAINVNDPTLRKIAQEINLAEMLLLQYLKEVSSNERGAVPLENVAVDDLSHLVVKELEYLRKVKSSEVVDVTGSFATFKSDDGEFLVTAVPEEELQRNFCFCFSNIKPRFAKPVMSRENFAVPSPSAESVYYDACYDLSSPLALNPTTETSSLGGSIYGLLSCIFQSTIGKMNTSEDPR